VEPVGKLRDGRVGASKLLQHAAPRGIRKRRERGIKAGCLRVNHMVQYLTRIPNTCKSSALNAFRVNFKLNS